VARERPPADETAAPPTLRTASAAATFRAAAALGRLVQAGDVVGLCGDLGAGKTCFVKGLAEGLGIDPGLVSSPTFTLINEYGGGRLLLHHVDLYRLADAGELPELGLEDLLAGSDVCAVEWIDRFAQVAPPEWLEVRIEFAGPRARTLVPRGIGERGHALAQRWREAAAVARRRR
jgi:tRNA threonylcarbamoyladenosine biosynthesis protein TsaE